MKTELFVLMGLTAALLSLLLWFSLTVRQDSRGCGVVRRLFWAALLLWLSGTAGGVGLRFVSLAATAALGLPGFAALTALRLM